MCLIHYDLWVIIVSLTAFRITFYIKGRQSKQNNLLYLAMLYVLGYLKEKKKACKCNY